MWSWSWFGMSFIWWIFWVLLIVGFFAFLTPVPRAQVPRVRQTPLEILQRRYANGEITTAEYEERKQRLQHDRDASEHRAPVGPATPQPQ
jgi:putative membrane protein